MNELKMFEQTMTTKELADKLGTRPNVITENAKKCLPQKIIENGKVTLWNEKEIAVLIEYMKSNRVGAGVNLSNDLIGISTKLTPALKLKKAMDMACEAYEEELANLRAENAEKQAIIDRITEGKGCYSLSQTAKALKLPYGRNTLNDKLKQMGLLLSNGEPYQEQINAGHFKVVVKYINDFVGNKSVTLTTGKGLVYLAKRFDTEIDNTVLADA